MGGALGGGEAVILCGLEHVLVDTDAVVVAECGLVLRVWVALCGFYIYIYIFTYILSRLETQERYGNRFCFLLTYQICSNLEISKRDRFVLVHAPTFEVRHAELVQGHDQFFACHDRGLSSIQAAHPTQVGVARFARLLSLLLVLLLREISG